MENESKNITNSLAHTKWNCKYHIVSPKYRRKVFFEEKRGGDPRDSEEAVCVERSRDHRR